VQDLPNFKYVALLVIIYIQTKKQSPTSTVQFLYSMKNIANVNCQKKSFHHTEGVYCFHGKRQNVSEEQSRYNLNIGLFTITSVTDKNRNIF